MLMIDVIVYVHVSLPAMLTAGNFSCYSKCNYFIKLIVIVNEIASIFHNSRACNGQ